MPSKICPNCKIEIESEDLGKPADNYYCPDCGWNECDIYGYADRMADHADFLRKQQKEGEL